MIQPPQNGPSDTGVGQDGEDGFSTPLAETAILRIDGAILQDPAGFLARTSLADRLRLAEIAHANPSATSYEVLAPEGQQLTTVAVALRPQAQTWHAPPEGAPNQSVIVRRLAPQGVHARLEGFGKAFGLSPAVIRVVRALYEHCDVRAAAAAAGLSFNTAREYLHHARATIWAPNLPRLITWAGVGSLGLDASGESDQAVGALFSLSERQRRLAGLIADGASRAEAAERLGLSEALAKKELALIFAATGVENAMALARLFAELRGLAIMAREACPAEPYPPPLSRTVMVTTATGRRIVASDYGPSGGKPVIVLHNTMNCRGVDRALVAALQDSGYRPVSPDRPGYGDTDPAPPGWQGEDYLKVCVEDIAALCAHMGWRRVPFIAHGPAHLVLALLRLRPDLAERVVIDAPEPDSASGSAAQGMIPGLKRHFARRPWAVASVFRILTSLASYERISAFMRDWTAASPADQRAMGDPRLMMDFYRKLTPFRRGRIDGLVREQVLQATAGKPERLDGATELVLIIGATDFMHDADETVDYWRSVLPDSRLVVLPDAGRFISYSHPHRLVEELRRATRRSA